MRRRLFRQVNRPRLGSSNEVFFTPDTLRCGTMRRRMAPHVTASGVNERGRSLLSTIALLLLAIFLTTALCFYFSFAYSILLLGFG